MADSLYTFLCLKWHFTGNTGLVEAKMEFLTKLVYKGNNNVEKRLKKL